MGKQELGERRTPAKSSPANQSLKLVGENVSVNQKTKQTATPGKADEDTKSKSNKANT